jgi:hypothetical protein
MALTNQPWQKNAHNSIGGIVGGPPLAVDERDYAAQCDPAPMSPANECVTDIFNGLDQLSKTIEALKEQIDPILAPEKPTNPQESKPSAIHAQASPLVESLRTIDVRIRAAHQELQRIGQRIEL